MSTLRFSFITLFSLFFLTSCFDYEDVDFKGVDNFSLVDKSADNITVRLDLRVKNPNNYNIKIKKSSLDIFINGNKAGKTKMKDDIVLKKGVEGVYPIYLKTNGKEILSSMGSLGSLLTGSLKVRIKGNVKAKVYGIGKKFPIDVEEPVSLGSMF